VENEANFFFNLEKKSAINGLIGGALLIPTLTLLPAIVPTAIIGFVGTSIVGYCGIHGYIYLNAFTEKEEMDFRLSEVYHYYKIDIEKDKEEYKMLDRYSKYVLITTLLICLSFILYISYNTKKFWTWVFLFLAICLIQTYILTYIMEDMKVKKNRYLIGVKLFYGCNRKFLTFGGKVKKRWWDLVKHDKETGTFIDDPECEKLKLKKQEFSNSMLHSFIIMITTIGLSNLKLIYTELDFTDKMYTAGLGILIAFMYFVYLRYFREKLKEIPVKQTIVNNFVFLKSKYIDKFMYRMKQLNQIKKE
jgi:multisubunit Na+/H+ antiporter MnhG subunit